MSTNSATINGRTYNTGTTFAARTNFTGKSASDGTGNNSTITAGSTYCFVKYNAGAKYPYAIGTGGSTTVRCWVQASVFPYATYGVYYNANGGSGAPSAQTKTYGTNLTLSSTRPTRTGYTFKGWATSANGSVVYGAGSIYTANAGVTLYAVWQINTYAVRYDANGGTGAPSAQTKTYGTTLKLSSTIPTRTGYTFKGWATSASGSAAYAAGANYTSNAAITLYAVWEIKTYSVQYNANGGTGAPSAQTKRYGTDLVLSSTIPTRTGYTFKGWATSASGSVAYSSGAAYSSNAAITLYAVWEANTYSVIFNANGANGTMGNQTMTYDSSKELTANTFYRTGYTFKGWATSANGIMVYDDVAIVRNLTSVAGGTITLYAVWVANSYTIKYDASTNGGTGNTEVIRTYGSKLGALPVATKQYYVFLGWYTAATGGRKVTEDTVVTGDLKLYAQYAIDASVYIRVNGELKAGFPYVFSNGKWRKGYAYVNIGDSWQQGLSE